MSAITDRRRQSHWDWLSLTAHAWQEQGMTPASFAPFVRPGCAPILVIGSGAGPTQRWLTDRGHQTLGVDRSLNMIRAARSARPLPVMQADGRALPFRSDAFNTVIVSTGVLDIDDDQGRRDICAEAFRVLAPTGQLILGFFSPADNVVATGQHLGYMDGLRLYQNRIGEIWLRGRCERAWSEAVSEWCGISVARARVRVRCNKPTLDAIFRNVERIASAARERGEEPGAYVRAAFDYSLFGYRYRVNEELVICAGGTPLATVAMPSVSTATMRAGKNIAAFPERAERGEALPFRTHRRDIVALDKAGGPRDRYVRLRLVDPDAD